jgi:hypothetical protein
MKNANRIIIGLLLFGSVISCLFMGFLDLSNSQQPNQNFVDTTQETFDLNKPPGSPKESSSVTPDRYNRQAAYGYAYKWWDGANPHYNDYSGSGGDCANFVSQCLIAGGFSLHNGTDGTGYGVYPDEDRTGNSYGTMPYCDYLNLNLRNWQDTTVSYTTEPTPDIPAEITVGDVVMFGEDSGDKYEHAMIVVWDNGTFNLGLAGHSSKVWNLTFSDVMFGASSFDCATFYHFNERQAEQYHFKVDTGALNVRVGPGKNNLSVNYQDIGDIHDGEEYIAFGEEKDEAGNWWWHFWFDDRAAWCAARFTINVTGDRIIEVNINNYLNVRDGPGTGYSIYGQVYDGMRFVSDMSDGSWYRFWYGGEQKYSHGNYLDELPKPNINFTKPVMGYLPYWVSNRDQNFSVVSHLAWFAIEINADGTIGDTHEWPEWDVINAVHDAGHKIILTVILFDDGDIHNLLKYYKTTAVNNLLAQVQAGNADGINIDFEMPTTSGDDVLLVEFMQLLYTTFKNARNDYHISIASPSVDWWGTWDYEELNNYVDAFMIMAYGYYYSGSSNAGPLSPLERPGYTYDVNWSVNDYISKGASISKIILGLPFYGLDFPVTSTVKHAARDSGRSTSSPTYSSIMNTISTYSPTIYYDNDYETAWFNYDPGDGDHQVWFDNYTSLERKFDYINNRNLGGLGIWAYGYQGAYTELEQLIINKFSLDPNLPPGAFSLFTDADDPDVDGEFNLNWTISTGADYYSVYQSSSPIMSIGSGILIESDLIVNYTKIMNLKSDYYYYAVVAQNETGFILSNYVDINVLLPAGSSSGDDDDDSGSTTLLEILTSPIGMFTIGVSTGILIAALYGIIKHRAHKSTQKERDKLHIISRDARRDHK